VNPHLHGRIGEELIFAELAWGRLPESEQFAAHDRLFVVDIVRFYERKGMTRNAAILWVLNECVWKSEHYTELPRKAHRILRKWGLRPDFNGVTALRHYVDRLDYSTSDLNHVFLMIDPVVARSVMGMEARRA
jgi:hypothetical protein